MRTAPSRLVISTTLMLAFLGILHTSASRSAHAFAGFGPEACADLVTKPQRFWRQRDGTITYRISNNFSARYPDLFSQYLVTDVARWWEDYINGGYVWSADIANRFSYFRQDPEQSVYELKSVLNHEFGHALGMQHSDACYYNINESTDAEWTANHRSAGGGLLAVQPTIGPELMNEIWTESSPGMKAPKELGIDGYNRLPGRDGWEFLKHAYPFQQLSFEEVDSNDQVVLFDSTDADSSGGQTSYPGGTSAIVPGDSDQGRFMDGVNVWIGNDIGLRNRYEGWSITNNTGSDITQVTLRIAGSSTRRAITESAPTEFADFGVGATSAPEVMQYAWSTVPAGDHWDDGSTDWFSMSLDVHDWVVTEALMWHYSNDAWPIPLPGIVAEVPWGFATPQTPPPGTGPGYTVVSEQPEPSIEPTDIELLPAPARRPSGHRGISLTLPNIPDVRVSRIALLPLTWMQAEIMARDDSPRRNDQLQRAFDTRRGEVIDLIEPAAQGYDAAQIGLVASEPAGAFSHADANASGPAILTARWPVPLDDSVTYATLVTATTGKVSATLLSLPEMTEYLGTRAARCALADDASSCCPHGSRLERGSSSADRLGTPSTTACILGQAGDDTVVISGDQAHVVAAGDGNDDVYAAAPDSIITLGRGDDVFHAARLAASHVIAGQGADDLRASDRDDHLDGGEGDDRIEAGDGDDIVIGGPGSDTVVGGPGNDTLLPGSGADHVDGGDGDDRVVISHVCELDAPKQIVGGRGNDTLVLPVSLDDARRLGLSHSGFERIVENAHRAARISDCE